MAEHVGYSGTEQKAGKPKVLVARTPSKESSNEVALNMRVAELERRLEEQRTNFNNHVSAHNKSIKKHLKLVKTEMTAVAKNLNLAI